MPTLKHSIANKILLFILLAVLISGVAVGAGNFFNARNTLIESINSKMTALLGARKTALSAYLNSIQEDLVVLSSNDQVRTALEEFKAAWTDLGGDQTQKLQRFYIEENPNPLGEKEKLDYAPDGSKYSDIHAKQHLWFREFLQKRGYYDIFLFAPNGDLVYTVFKELDYATNLNSGEWKDTDLGNVFRAALANDDAHFFDFRAYAASNNVPASFIGKRVKSASGDVLGVLVFQMPVERINRIMADYVGLGETGETYLVGADKLMRSNSRFSKEATILVNKIDGLTVDNALKGQKGLEVINDYRGISVFSAYDSLDFNGTRWVILAEQDEAEVLQPLVMMGLVSGGISLLVIILVGAFGLGLQ